MRILSLLALVLSSACASVPGGPPVETIHGFGLRYGPAATRPWTGAEEATASAAEALAAVRFDRSIWIDVLGPEDAISNTGGIGRTAFHVSPELMGTWHRADRFAGLSFQDIVIVKQAKPGTSTEKIPHACESVLFWEVTRLWVYLTKDSIDVNHTDPDGNAIMADMNRRCREKRRPR